jgi:hypothetical protein
MEKATVYSAVDGGFADMMCPDGSRPQTLPIERALISYFSVLAP